MSDDLVVRLSSCAELDLVPGSVVQIGSASCRALAAHGPVVVRLVRPGDPRHAQFLHTMRDHSPWQNGLLQRLLSTATCAGDTVAVFEWLHGDTARTAGHHLLPRFFESLARWHRQNRCGGQVYSPYTGEEYPDLAAFVDGEARDHFRVLGRPDMEDRCLSTLRPIAAGFTTVLHGDVHPGNILHAEDGTFRLLDPEYVHVGANFLDLDYIDWLALEPSPVPWWVIGDYGCASAGAYLRTLGIADTDADPIMRAAVLLTALRSHTNAQKYSPDKMEEMRHRIERILEKG